MSDSEGGPLSTVTPFPGTVPGQHQQPKLLDRVRIAIRTRHYSLRTEEAYVGWIRRYIFFHNKRHPLEMGEPEINSFLSHLAVKDQVSASTQNQALCALVFLYRHVLEKPFPTLDKLIRAKRPVRLPVVMTRAEVKRVLQRLDGVNRVMGMLLYGSGMRLLECLRLRVKDIEFGMGRILVRDAKGQKDRFVPLPSSVRPQLVSWLAPCRRPRRPKPRGRPRIQGRRAAKCLTRRRLSDGKTWHHIEKPVSYRSRKRYASRIARFLSPKLFLSKGQDGG